MKISTLRCEFGRDRFHVADIVVREYTGISVFIHLVDSVIGGTRIVYPVKYVPDSVAFTENRNRLSVLNCLARSVQAESGPPVLRSQITFHSYKIDLLESPGLLGEIFYSQNGTCLTEL